jgi:hypothetical protein
VRSRRMASYPHLCPHSDLAGRFASPRARSSTDRSRDGSGELTPAGRAAPSETWPAEAAAFRDGAGGGGASAVAGHVPLPAEGGAHRGRHRFWARGWRPDSWHDGGAPSTAMQAGRRWPRFLAGGVEVHGNAVGVAQLRVALPQNASHGSFSPWWPALVDGSLGLPAMLPQRRRAVAQPAA